LSGHSTDSLEAYCRRIVPHAALVICVSKATRDDLRTWLEEQRLPVPTFGVFRLGEDFTAPAPRRPGSDAFIRSGLTGRDYMLTVGTVEARKNHTLLYYVHKLAKQRGIKLPPSVVVGRRGWKTEQIYDFITEDPEVREQFVFLHDTDDAELSWLYENALLTVIPSMYEGWGMPIAESVAKGVPCACANTTSMVEIAEGFVNHFSPFSTDECLEQVLLLLDEKNRAVALARLADYTPHSWDASAAEVLSMIEGLCRA
jgi:glycosyltransferase involved in cell wall biosynthesis